MSTEVAVQICNLYQLRGEAKYGEHCSVNSHSIQSAILARGQGLSTMLIGGAFLHDIGHICMPEIELQTMETYGIVDHEGIGAKYLKEKGFPTMVIDVVGYHVAAKRYLCSINPSYLSDLSEASSQTFIHQGGKMTQEEIHEFRAHPHFKEIVIVRKIDDEAKADNFEITPDHWKYIRSILSSLISSE